jgi:hypothetical protein
MIDVEDVELAADVNQATPSIGEFDPDQRRTGESKTMPAAPTPDELGGETPDQLAPKKKVNKLASILSRRNREGEDGAKGKEANAEAEAQLRHISERIALITNRVEGRKNSRSQHEAGVSGLTTSRAAALYEKERGTAGSKEETPGDIITKAQTPTKLAVIASKDIMPTESFEKSKDRQRAGRAARMQGAESRQEGPRPEENL